MLRFNTKQQLVEALEARRRWCINHDRHAAADHKQAEAAALQAIKTLATEIGKLSLPKLKDYITEYKGRNGWAKLIEVELPDCPMSAVTMLDATLEYLEATRQEKFILTGDRGDSIRYAHWLLTASDVKRKATVCQ